MSRQLDDVINSTGISTGFDYTMANPGKNGHHGWAPAVGDYLATQAYVRKPLIVIALEAPRFFDLMPEPDKWRATFKNMFETAPRTVEGFSSGLTVESDEHPVGGAGEFQEEPTDVKRARTRISLGLIERYGNPWQLFLNHWITYGIMDPETKYALSGTLAGQKPDDMLADWYGGTILAFEPDPIHRKVNPLKAWISTNIWPKSNGEIIGRRDLTTAGELTNLSIEFASITTTGVGVVKLAQKILDSINITNANPYLRAAFIDDISADLRAVEEAVGYSKSVKEVAEKATPIF